MVATEWHYRRETQPPCHARRLHTTYRRPRVPPLLIAVVALRPFPVSLGVAIKNSGGGIEFDLKVEVNEDHLLKVLSLTR
ncbi:putative cytochrome c6, chloroplastic-like [Sesbania bispinosa]|nr:putative cytochrome c6, chloroplastic-like [Sesbania bispinosa]